MSFIIWTDDFSVGVAQFDSDHRKLIEYINTLHIGMISGHGLSEMSEILDALVDYTRFHFKREADLMEKFFYPDYESHKSEHELFIEKVNDFISLYKKGKKAFTLELMSFLRDWLTNHIKGTDMKYRDFFLAKGVK